MNETWIIILYIGFWILTAIGSIAMIIWAIASRIKEKKIEKEKHKKYKEYLGVEPERISCGNQVHGLKAVEITEDLVGAGALERIQP